MTFHSEPCDYGPHGCELIASWVASCPDCEVIVACNEHLVTVLSNHMEACSRAIAVTHVMHNPPCNGDPCQFEDGNRRERCPFCEDWPDADITSSYPGDTLSIRSDQHGASLSIRSDPHGAAL